MNSRISIGLTCFNAQASIVGAVESALSQDCPDIEVIVVDDASKDGSWDVLLKLAQDFPDKVHIFRNDKNLGVAGSRNRIIAEATGEFLAFFDDDDVSLPHRVRIQRDRILAYEERFSKGAPVICHSARLQKYPDGREGFAPTIGCADGREAPCGDDVAARILYNKKITNEDGAMATCSQMARLSVYRQLGGFDESFRRMEDTEFNVRLALAGGHFIGVAEPLVVQTMTQAGDKRISDERKFALALYSKHQDFLVRQGRGHFDVEWLEVKHDFWEGKRIGFLMRLAGLFLRHPLLSFERVVHSLPNFGYNAALRRFHADEGKGE